MKKHLSCAAAVLTLVLASGAVPVWADTINLQYTTFGGNTPTTEGALTPDMGTAVVNGNSATLTSNNAEVGAVWMDSSPNSTANVVSLSFDISVLSQAASGYGQSFGGAETLGGVRFYQTAAWATSFQLMPTSATTGYFAFRDAANSGVQSIAAYNTNTLYHVQLSADYLNGIATASVNGGPGVNYALRPGTVPGGTTSEIFVYLNGATGADVHNSFQISDAAVVPLPSTAALGLVGLGALGLSQMLRKRLFGAMDEQSVLA